ncbi:MAG TPA: 2-oxo-4-hydroxy-4-carboxy-5-ureidoimidazoline decarboxylase [Bryobacteraceae bacterium]|jgi:2-oxo-4-hydroxy-4-carboxy-5-ureidoimidazoline decarboxylase
MTIAQVNDLDDQQFVQQVGWVFEHSPWVAGRACASRPFPSAATLHEALVKTMYDASEAEQLALLCAHPDLGHRARMSEASTSEQSGAGLEELTQTEFEELQLLNSEYKQKFGFPFLYAVKGSTKHDILAALRSRLPQDRDSEFKEALRQVTRIARFRLESLIDGTIS